MSQREPMTEQELLACLKDEYDRASNHYDSEIAPLVKVIQSFYDAEEFGDELEGLSRIVLPDVQETVDYMVISVLRTFVSGDRVVEFEARDEGGEDAADQASEVIGQLFMRDQDGYRVLHDWLKNGLMKFGVVKTTAFDERKVITDRMIAETEDDLILAHEEAEVSHNGDGTFLVEHKREVIKTRYEDMVLPFGEYIFSPRARSEDGAAYQCHRVRKTRSDLVEMGFDAEQVDSLSTNNDAWEIERNWEMEARHHAMQEVTLLEEYISVDMDGDGVAETLKVFRVDGVILEVQPHDEPPFTVFSPFPKAGALIGLGLAEKTMDLQRLRSFIARQLIDGLVQGNRPRPWLDMSMNLTDETMDDILNIVPGAPIRGRGPVPGVLNTGVNAGQSLSVLEWATGERESRTGITRLNQGLDADALNKTATGTGLMQAQGQQHEEFIARNFAECLSRMFLKKLKLIKDAGHPLRVKMKGQFVEVDPATWPDEMDVVIRVGLGTGSKDKRLAMAMQLLQIQREAMPLGLAGPQHLYRTAEILVKDGLGGQPDDFFTSPEQMQPQEPQKDPKLAEIEAQAQHNAVKLQGEQQLSAAKIDIARAESEAKLQLRREEAAAEAVLAREKMQLESELAMQRMLQEAELSARRADHVDSLSSYRPGGDLSQ